MNNWKFDFSKTRNVNWNKDFDIDDLKDDYNLTLNQLQDRFLCAGPWPLSGEIEKDLSLYFTNLKDFFDRRFKDLKINWNEIWQYDGQFSNTIFIPIISYKNIEFDEDEHAIVFHLMYNEIQFSQSDEKELELMIEITEETDASLEVMYFNKDESHNVEVMKSALEKLKNLYN